MNKREQTLGIGFGLLLLGGGAFVGLTQLKSWKQRVDQRSIQLDTRQVDAKELMSEQELWAQRSAWLAEKQPEFTKRGEADLSLLNLIRDTAEAQQVTIEQNQPQPPTEKPGLTSSTYSVQAKADLGAMLKWLHAIQEPNAFISISSFAMVPNEEDTSQVRVNMLIEKWFRLPPA
jgi:hypothetical protein